MKKNFRLAVFDLGLVLFGLISTTTLARDFTKEPKKALTKCAMALQESLDPQIPKLSGLELIQAIEDSFVTKSEAGRLGFGAAETPVRLSRSQTLAISELLNTHNMRLEDFREAYIEFATEFPSGSPDEWIRALAIGLQLKKTPQRLKTQLLSIAKEISFPATNELSFGKHIDQADMKFSHIFDIWLMARQLKKTPKVIGNLVSETGDLFPSLNLEDLLDLLLWSHMSKTSLPDLKNIAAEIQTHFQLTTRKSIGFSNEHVPAVLSIEQALVIHKISILTQTPLEKLLEQFQALSASQQTQELEDIIGPLRNSVQATLDELMK